MNWIEVPAGKYKLLAANNKRSHCQLEFTFRCGLVFSNGLKLANILLPDTMASSHMHLRVTGPT